MATTFAVPKTVVHNMTLNVDHHEGWLKKEGGKIKTTKRRFFVLSDNDMVYYTDGERKKPCGQFCVAGNDVEVLETREDAEHEKFPFPFIIKPGRGRGRVTDGHENYTLWAPTEEDRAEWVRKLKFVMYREKGGAVFGFPLTEAMQCNHPDSPYVPTIIHDCTQHLKKNGLDMEGIFRLGGQRKLVRQLADAYDRGERPLIDEENSYEMKTVSSVLKLYLRELPEPVIPYDFYDKLKASGWSVNEGANLDLTIGHLRKLPKANYNLLYFLCHFLDEVAKWSDENRMTPENLASMFAPNILRSRDWDPDIEASATDLISCTIAAYINHFRDLFVDEMTPFHRAKVSRISIDTILTPPQQETTNLTSTLAESGSSLGGFQGDDEAEASAAPGQSDGELNHSPAPQEGDLEKSASLKRGANFLNHLSSAFGGKPPRRKSAHDHDKKGPAPTLQSSIEDQEKTDSIVRMGEIIAQKDAQLREKDAEICLLQAELKSARELLDTLVTQKDAEIHELQSRLGKRELEELLANLGCAEQPEIMSSAL